MQLTFPFDQKKINYAIVFLVGYYGAVMLKRIDGISWENPDEVYEGQSHEGNENYLGLGNRAYAKSLSGSLWCKSTLGHVRTMWAAYVITIIRCSVNW